MTDWTSGVFNSKPNPFDSDVYEAVYRRHLRNLGKWQSKDIAGCSRRQAELWTAAWKLSGLAPPAGDDLDDFDDDDLARASEDE